MGLEEPGVTLRIVGMESLALQWCHMGYKSGAGTEKDFRHTWIGSAISLRRNTQRGYKGTIPIYLARFLKGKFN